MRIYYTYITHILREQQYTSRMQLELRVCFVFSTCMHHVCFVFSTCMLHVCFVFSTCMPHAFFVFSTCMPHVCFVFSTCMHHVCFVFSTCMPHVCFAHSLTCTFTHKILLCASASSILIVCYTTYASCFLGVL